MPADISDLIKAARERKRQMVETSARLNNPQITKTPQFKVFISLLGPINVTVANKRVKFAERWQNYYAYKTAHPEEIEELRKNKYVQEITETGVSP